MTDEERKAWENLVALSKGPIFTKDGLAFPILAADAELKRLNKVLDCWEQWACPEIYGMNR